MMQATCVFRNGRSLSQIGNWTTLRNCRVTADHSTATNRERKTDRLVYTGKLWKSLASWTVPGRQRPVNLSAVLRQRWQSRVPGLTWRPFQHLAFPSQTFFLSHHLPPLFLVLFQRELSGTWPFLIHSNSTRGTLGKVKIVAKPIFFSDTCTSETLCLSKYGMNGTPEISSWVLFSRMATMH